jgi:hypothetical protein
MPRTLTPRAILEAQRTNSNAVFLVLMTIHIYEVLAVDDIRIVNNTEDLWSLGRLFIGYPFRITLPEDVDEVITSQATVEIDNVDPRIWEMLRGLTFSPRVTLEVVIADEPDSTVLSTTGLKLREATATTRVISATLIPDTIWQQGYPEGDFDPPQNPGLFS